VIAIAAMISTFSAINATLLGGSRVNYEVAEDHELPAEFTKMLWGKPIGLLLITVLTVLVANTIDLESISTSGSAGFLIIFAMVNFVAFKKATEIKAKKLISFFAFIFCTAAFIILVVQQYQSNPIGIVIALSIFALCFVGEWLYSLNQKA
jgi:amino acid transporter